MVNRLPLPVADTCIQRKGRPLFKKYIPDFKQLPFGYIIGKVTLTEVTRIGTGSLFNTSDEMMNKLTMEEKAFGDYTPGRFAWLLRDPIAFKDRPVQEVA